MGIENISPEETLEIEKEMFLKNRPIREPKDGETYEDVRAESQREGEELWEKMHPKA